MLTLAQVQETLPAGSKSNITQHMINQLNTLSADPEEARAMQDNFISYAQVLREGRFRLGDYVSAVVYVSHKIMNKSNVRSYEATFPGRYQNMVAAGKPTKDIASIVSAYNKGLLVTKIMERAIVPTWVLNQDKFQAAINVQYDLMSDTDVSDKVRCEAANSLLNHLKKPEVHKSELKIDIPLNDGMAALQASIVKLAQDQQRTIEHNPNISAKIIATTPMINVTGD